MKLFKPGFQANWPLLAGLCAGMCGLLMLVMSWYFQRQAHQPLAATPPVLSNQVPAPRTPSLLPPPSETTFVAPAPNTHLDDLARLFKLARDRGVNIGTIEYRFETTAALPLLIRTLDLRINEDYPKLKIFVAELLNAMPHAALQEIRVERKDTAASPAQIMLKLSFVYQATAKNAVGTPAQYRARSPEAKAGDHTP